MGGTEGEGVESYLSSCTPACTSQSTALSSPVKQGLERGNVQVPSTKRRWALQAAALHTHGPYLVLEKPHL